jgi:hypothetical protein
MNSSIRSSAPLSTSLVIGSRYDTMVPAHKEQVAHQVPHGDYLYFANSCF